MRPTRRRVSAAFGLALAALAPVEAGFANGLQHEIGFWAIPVRAEASGEAEYLGSFTWIDSRPEFGGFSGLQMDQDGGGATVLSDRGYLIEVRFDRDALGQISGVSAGPTLTLRTTTGAPVQGGHADSEGLRRLPDGRLCVSFENNARISCHSAPEAAAELLPRHPDFADLPRNASLESLAADQAGRLYTLPEQPDISGNFRLYRLTEGKWEQPFTLPARDGFLITDADFGPDGRFYILERKVALTTGFLSRVRSFVLTDSAAFDEREVIAPAAFRHGNLEGLSLWQDDKGAIRLTLVADNAQLPIFRNEIAEYRLSPLP